MVNKLLGVTLALLFVSAAFAVEPEFEHNGTFYIYSFLWDNGDFDADTKDGDQFFYVHADVGVKADFGAGVTSQVTLGGWGTFGKHPITGEGEQGGTPGENVAVREAYINFANLFDSPLSFRAGKMHVLQGEHVFDGGEDGIMGAKFMLNTEGVDADLAWYRLIENAGCWCIGTGIPAEDDLDLFGLWITGKFMEDKVKIAPYGFWRTISTTTMVDTVEMGMKDNPMWVGGRLDATPIEGFDLVGEFTMMMGKNEVNGLETDYTGMHYMGRLSYLPPGFPAMIGGAYVHLGGDDATTIENEHFESPVWGPYAFNFYKWWPGFGPAHLHRTAYGFSMVLPLDEFGNEQDPIATNLNVINGNIATKVGELYLRFDFFKYDKDQVAAGVSKDMGMEFALLGTYTYNAITVGATGGYWMPGDYFLPGEDAMLAGYIFTFITF